MFDKLINYFKSDSTLSDDNPLDTKGLSFDEIHIALLAASSAAWNIPTYTSAAVEGYADNPIVYRAINLRGDGIGALRWIVVDENNKEVPNHPLQKLIDRPNTQQSQSEFFSSLSKYRDLGGDGYILANRDENSRARPGELSLIRPDQVVINPGEFGIPASYDITSGNGGSKTISVDSTTGKSNILQWKLFNPVSDLNGLSPLSAAAKPVDVFNEAENHSKKLLQNGATLGGVLSTDQKLDKDQIRRLAEAVEKKYAGAANAGRMMIAEGGLKYSATGQTLKEMMLIELQTEQARYICQALSVPDQLVGLPGSSTFANFAEARTFFLENTLMPMAESLQESLNMWLTPMFGGKVKIKYDVTSVPGYEERRTELFARLESVTFMTTNEKRDQAGLEPIDGGDTINTITTPTTDDATTDVANGDDE